MNDTRLNKPVLVNKKYVIYLDSENKFKFSDKRKASDFLTKIQKEIDQASLLITEEYNLLSEFYRLYYHLDKDFKFKHSMKLHIDYVSNRLNFMQDHTGSPNWDSIVFNSLLACFDELINGFNLMGAKAQQRKDPLTRRRCILKSDILSLYLNNFLKLGIKPNRVELPMTIVYSKKVS